MSGRCANVMCSAPRRTSEGTVFRLDITLANLAGRESRRSMFLWLCPSCAAALTPSVEVTDTAVRLILSARGPDSLGPHTTVN
jgi:hypothetical protein